MPDNIVELRSVIEIQIGGPTNDWQVIDLINPVADGSAGIDAVKGGGRDYELRYARDYTKGAGTSKVIGQFPTKAPQPLNGILSVRAHFNNTARKLVLDGSKFNLRVRYSNAAWSDPLNYTGIRQYNDCRFTDTQFSDDISKGADPVSKDLMEKFPFQAASELEERPCVTSNISGTVTTKGINCIICTDFPIGADNAIERQTGDKEFFAVTDFVGAATPPNLLFTIDGGVTWTTVALPASANDQHAKCIVKAGTYLVIACKGAAAASIVYAKYDDIKNGVGTAAFAVATGNPSAFAQATNWLEVAPDGTLWAAADAGYIYKSTDNGLSWSVFSAGTLSTNALFAADFSSGISGWFGGANATLIKYNNGTITKPTITGMGGAAQVTKIVAPLNRPQIVIIGTNEGKIYRSKDGAATFVSLSFPNSGTGTVTELRLSSDDQIIYLLHTNVSTKTAIMRDLSGGNFGKHVEIIGSYTAPANGQVNSVASANGNPNFALAVGAIITGQGYIGNVVPTA